MKNKYRNVCLSLSIFFTLLLMGCVRAMLPTSIPDFEANSYKSKPFIISTNYINAYANLKKMYTRCLNVNNGSTYLSPEAKLDREKENATIKLYGSHGTILQIIEIKKTNPNESSLIAAEAKNKLFGNISNDSSLDDFTSKIKGWADGSLTSCQT